MSTSNVLVTGFGPFGEHKINASWEAVKLLPNYKIEGINIVVEEIPVAYDHVENKLPLLWQKYNPKLVVHVGVSSFTSKLTIETRAFRSGYKRTDCFGKYHPTGEICTKDSGSDCIEGTIDAQRLCDFINNSRQIEACVSSDAGRYLCEFTYYKSLHIDHTRTLFIHVPPLEKPYTAVQLAEGIIEIIKCALQQICECKK